MDKDHRRELKRAARDAERLTFVERMPFPPAVAVQMFDAVDAGLEAAACRHDFGLTAGWCERQSIDLAATMAWLRSEGAGCDCEIYDVEDRLSDALGAFR